MIVKDSIKIKTTPKRIFDGLIRIFSSQEQYKKWHKDHVKCQWLKGNPFEEGSILYIEEYLHGKLHKMKFLITKLNANRKIEYNLLFPESIICPNGSFIIKPKKGYCIFTATLSFRFGGLLSKLMPARFNALKKHMKEEGKNLKKILEK